MSKGLRLLVGYLGAAWLLAGVGAFVPALNSRSDASEGQDFEIEMIKERSTASLKELAVQLKALNEQGEESDEAAAAVAEEIEALKEEATAVTAQMEAEVKALKAAAGAESGGIMALLGPVAAIFGGLILAVLAILLGGGKSYEDEEPKPRKKKRRPKTNPAAATPPDPYSTVRTDNMPEV